MNSTAVVAEPDGVVLPDHTQLPDRDGVIVSNFHEHPQSNLLTDSLRLRLLDIHPDGQFCIGMDNGIYYRFTEPVLDGCKSPDWFYVPNVPPMLNGEVRRSYVLWRETVHPRLVIEYVSGDGSEEHDTTPFKGKFWVYEQGICAAYYLIHDMSTGTIELYKRNGDRYHRVEANVAGRFPVEPLGVEFGIWHESYWEQKLPWLRAWDSNTGTMLPTSDEIAKVEARRADAEKERAETAELLVDEMRNMLNEAADERENDRRRADAAETRLSNVAEKLRAMGIDPKTVLE